MPLLSVPSLAEAASTMPSETPNFILRGARLATSTVSLPTSSSGWYMLAMPENTLRVLPSPASKVNCSSLVEPSTALHSRILAMRRSTLTKSSMVMVSAIGSISAATTALSVACKDCLLASSNFSTWVGSTRVSMCL